MGTLGGSENTQNLPTVIEKNLTLALTGGRDAKTSPSYSHPSHPSHLVKLNIFSMSYLTVYFLSIRKENTEE